MKNREMPLPSLEEVFICKTDTTAEEVCALCLIVVKVDLLYIYI